MFEKLYFLLMGPLYRRLSRDCTLHMQELKRVQLEFQDKFAARICDQMVALSVANSQQPTKPIGEFSDDDIIHLDSKNAFEPSRQVVAEVLPALKAAERIVVLAIIWGRRRR